MAQTGGTGMKILVIGGSGFIGGHGAARSSNGGAALTSLTLPAVSIKA
jgi:nucleoside-diphosphate-sugar epimerase